MHHRRACSRDKRSGVVAGNGKVNDKVNDKVNGKVNEERRGITKIISIFPAGADYALSEHV